MVIGPCKCEMWRIIETRTWFTRGGQASRQESGSLASILYDIGKAQDANKSTEKHAIGEPLLSLAQGCCKRGGFGERMTR
jgi:hypothetical protein